MATHYQRVWVCVSRPILNNAKTIILNTNPETSWIMRWLVYLLQSQTHLYHCMQPVRRSFKRQRGSKLLTNCSTTECTIKPVGSFQFPTDDLPCGLRDLAMTWSTLQIQDRSYKHVLRFRGTGRIQCNTRSRSQSHKHKKKTTTITTTTTKKIT